MKSNATTVQRPLSPIAAWGSVVVPILIALLFNLPRIIGVTNTAWSKFLRDETLLNLTLLFYLVSSVCYMLYVFQKEEVFTKIGSFLTVVGFTFHSTSFILRWVDVKRPPIGGINEVVLSFAWTLVLLNLILVQSSKFRFMNFISLPIATVAAFLATVFPTERSVHLVPALQSYWLYIHVTMAAFSYPTFALSFVLGLLYLIKDRVRPESFGVWIMGIVTLVYLSFNNFSLITTAKYYLDGFDPVRKRTIFLAKDTPMKVLIPYVGPLLCAALALSFMAFCFYLLSIKDKKYDRWALTVTKGSLAVQFVGLMVLACQIPTIENASFSSNPFELTGMVFALLATTMLYLITIKQEAIISLLPDKEKLDNLVYKTVTVGFPLLALQLITGAMWAGDSWGRYWGWDPKETWALITWLIYAAYLHTRMTRGLTGRKNVYFVLVGFVSVLFTYLGVTYLLSGLHSYK